MEKCACAQNNLIDKKGKFMFKTKMFFLLLVAGLSLVLASLMVYGAISLFFGYAQAATVWTPQTGIYNKYLVPPANTPKYVLAGDLETVKSHWVLQVGTYTQEKSSGGSARYVLNAVPTPPSNPECDKAKFVCHTDWGWIVDLQSLKEKGCEQVKIHKADALFYEGLRDQNGQPVCPVWSKSSQ